MQSTKSLTTKTKLLITKTGARYNPSASSAQNNQATWVAIQAALASGPQTYGSLMAVAKQFNHTPFVGYAVRRGWLAQPASK